MKQTYWKTVDEVIGRSNIVLYTIDARFPRQSRNIDVDRIIKRKEKKVIYVITKYDMIKGKRLELDGSMKPFCMVSARDFHGIGKLKGMIISLGKNMKIERPKVCVVGYPNIGKSSLINAIKGRGSAGISSEPGFTKGKQYVALKNFLLIDTPGVIPRSEKHDLKHLLISGVSGNSKEPDLAAIGLMEQLPGAVEKYFEVPVNGDKEATLAEIAAKKSLLLKGGEPDIERAAKMILNLYQHGKLN